MLDEFQWSPQPRAEELVLDLLGDFLSRNTFAAELSRRMKDETGTRFRDWLETIVLPDSPAIKQKIAAAGYQKYRDREGEYSRIYAQPQGIFPRIGLHE